jgi:oligopeptide transport system substrate-binding protein
VTIHYAALRQGDFQAALAGWIADYDDPQDFLLLFQDHTGSLNYSHYNSPKFEALMQEATDTVDIKKRAALMRQAEVTMISDVPIAPVWYSVNLSLVSTAVKGWVDNLQYIHPTRFLTLQR